MNEQTKAGASTPAQNQNQINAGGMEKRFDVFNYAENSEKAQIICDVCNPPLSSKPNRASKLCPECEAMANRTANVFFDNFKRHRKIYKLECVCFACSARKTSAMMSKDLPICRRCASELKTKGATAQSNFIARTVNNFLKGLKRAAV